MPEVLLREVIAEDLPIFFAQQLVPEATRMAAFPARDRAAFMAHLERILAEPAVVERTILCDGRVAGYAVSFERSGRRLIGYWLGREHWGRGIATRALERFLEEVERRPLYAHVAKHSVGSIRVLEKCGFVACGEDRVSLGAGGGVVEELIYRLGEVPG